MRTLQRTLTIVKPDAVRKNAIGDIIEQFEKNGFRILSMKMLEISKHQAEQFYAVHASKSFFTSFPVFRSVAPLVFLSGGKEKTLPDPASWTEPRILATAKKDGTGKSG